MGIAIMQPYIFPYIGYFQLVAAVETFVFYDDVHFIKKGWINKNRILLGGRDYTFTIPCVKVSQNKLIMETEVASGAPEIQKLINQMELAYSKAPFFEAVFPFIKGILERQHGSIASMAQASVEEVAQYLELKTRFLLSSAFSPHSRGMEKADRLIRITQEAGYHRYINAPGGKELYTPAYFNSHGVDLHFIYPQKGLEYSQGKSKNFVPWLSIIDVLMFCSKEQIQSMLQQYYLD